MDSTAYYLVCSASLANKTKGMLQVYDNLPKQLLSENRFVHAIRDSEEPTGSLLTTLELAIEQLLLLYSSQFEDSQVEMIADYFNALSFGFESMAAEVEEVDPDYIEQLEFQEQKHEQLLIELKTIENENASRIANIAKENEKLENFYEKSRREVKNLEKELADME